MAVQNPRAGGARPLGAELDPRARDEAERRDRHRSEQLADRCGDLEESLEVLKSRYDLYFLGVERREPSRERDEMRRGIALLKGATTANTGLRFRIETLHARFLSYDRMWMRTARQKEEGTYRRDVQRVRRQRRDGPSGKGVAPPPAAEAPAAADTATTAPGGAARPEPPRAAAAGRAPDESTLPAGMSLEQLRALHAAYVEAKRRCREDVSRLTCDALASTLSRQVPELLAKHKARAVEFRVVIKDGKAVLKAVPRA